MHRKTPVGVEGLQLYQKETPAKVFSCEYCRIFKNFYFEKYLQIFRIFSVVKSTYSGEIFCSDKKYSFYIRKL